MERDELKAEEQMKISIEELREICEFTLQELEYIDSKWNADNIPATTRAFVHPVTFEPCILIEFHNGRRGYVTLTVAEKAVERLDATDNRSPA